MSNSLTFTLTSPSLTTPLNSRMSSMGQIIIDINHSNPNFQLDKLPTFINSGGGITVDGPYPPFSQFTSISYDGSPLILYDANNNILANNLNILFPNLPVL